MPRIQPQKLYDDIQVLKQERKMIKDSLKDHYDNSAEFAKIKENLDAQKEKKKAYDRSVREAYQKDYDKIDRMTEQIKADEELLSDIAFQELMKENPVEIKDAK